MAFRSPLYSHPLRNGTYYYSPSTRPRPSPSPPKPKVVPIPVHFVGSDAEKIPAAEPSSAAIKIQRAVRGFLVRKNLKIVRRIEAEVAAIERRVKSQDEVDLIVREEKERLRINEMLMALLLRLDSVRGVRDYRKKVIRRVIMLQEIVDSISAVQFSESPEVDEVKTVERCDPMDISAAQLLSSDETLETKGLESEDQSSVDDQIKPTEVSSEQLADQTLESKESKVDLERSSDAIEEATSLENADQIKAMEIPQDENPDSVVEEAEAAKEPISADWEILETKEAAGEEQECAVEVPEARESEKVEEKGKEGAVEVLEARESEKVEEKEKGAVEVPEARESEKVEEKEGDVKDVILERMVAENEKLKGLVAELCQRSAQQCRLMGGLAERVEHLEKVLEKMERRRKKKRKDSCSPAMPLDKKGNHSC